MYSYSEASHYMYISTGILYTCVRVHTGTTAVHTCTYRYIHTFIQPYLLRVQENFFKTSRIQIFDLYPVVGYLVVRCFLIFFGGRFGRVSRGTLPILATIHAVLIKLHRECVYTVHTVYSHVVRINTLVSMCVVHTVHVL